MTEKTSWFKSKGKWFAKNGPLSVPLVPSRRTQQWVCTEKHKQEFTPFRVITTQNGKELQLVDVSPCNICPKLPAWIARVEAALADSSSLARTDIIGGELRACKKDMERGASWHTPRYVVEYLLQENQFRGASLPWRLDDARRWLDGDDEIEVLSNMEKALAEDARVQRTSGASEAEIRKSTAQAIKGLAQMMGHAAEKE